MSYLHEYFQLHAKILDILKASTFYIHNQLPVMDELDQKHFHSVFIIIEQCYCQAVMILIHGD